MLTLDVRNAHRALPLGLCSLFTSGRRRDSRAGGVYHVTQPVTTAYRRPDELVVFHPERDANPFFHLMEALWMLGGRDDAEFVSRFNARIKQFAQDDGRFHGAYGKRWRGHFGFDQLDRVADNLRENPDCRRQVLAMWDAPRDLLTARDASQCRDVPCNTHVYVSRDADGCLDVTVGCRSNDIVWGCYGSDSVTFGILQQYLAAAVGCEVGRYWQMSNNYHGYVTTAEPLVGLIGRMYEACPYELEEVEVVPLVSNLAEFRGDLDMLLDEGTRGIGYKNRFIRSVTLPMMRAYEHFRDRGDPRRFAKAKMALDAMPRRCDWLRACVEWLDRKEEEACTKKS